MVMPGFELPVSSSRSSWQLGDRWGTAVRVVLFLVLAAGSVLAVAALHQPWRQQDDLLSDLAAGRVRYVEYEPSGQLVHWVDDSWMSWSQTQIATWQTTPGDGSTSSSSSNAAEQWLHRQIAASPYSPITVNRRVGQGPDQWLEKIAWGPLKVASLVVWLVTLVMMLGRRRHRYANRWAWFWLFNGTGPAGLLLYLVLEPHPAWQPASPLTAERAPIRGGAGLLLSLSLSLLLSLAAAGIAAIP